MDFKRARDQLIEHLRTEIKDERVLATMASVPRELFVTPEQRHLAYEDRPLPITYEQTISQPFIVALMTQELELHGKEKVLEIGTGSGYQTAILAKLVQSVVTVERLEPLAKAAKKVLAELGYQNVSVHLAGEILGWPEGAPYDAIIATAAAPAVPADLLAQLAIGGSIVIPIGSLHQQELCKFTKQKEKTHVTHLGGCRFVALIGKGAWEKEKKGFSEREARDSP